MVTGENGTLDLIRLTNYDISAGLPYLGGTRVSQAQLLGLWSPPDKYGPPPVRPATSGQGA